MSLLKLSDVGKIYVSEGSVAVGIRGVNLSFDRGEFVAVTGKSGSGKSTLLNVISGMDSYEEGELYIEGQTTSHYLQPEWEAYREKYISFIFQDYNIIESFTVLQNVELALMHIEDKKQRRARAMELIKRVGLGSHVKHKGSKLSGGQKQRTVIARALAKDSPIILADEPTGNLDSTTSKEIIKLLREVSKDKLLIVVTHNFEQVESYATRHIRVFDGAVESDSRLKPTPETRVEEKQATEAEVKVDDKKKKRKKRKKALKNGIALGRILFTSKPRLSAFLCILMIVGMLGVFLMTSLCGSAADLLKKNYMFTHIDGRVVVTTRTGEVISEAELADLASKYGADSYLRYDYLLDEGDYNYVEYYSDKDGYAVPDSLYLSYVYGEDYGKNIVGRYPEAVNEVLLYLPISMQPEFGKTELKITEIYMNYMTLNVTGIKYYYDNNLAPKCLFTEEGFRTATAVYYLCTNSEYTMSLTVTSEDKSVSRVISLNRMIPSFDMTDNKLCIVSTEYENIVKSIESKGQKSDATLDLSCIYYSYNYNYENYSNSLTFDKSFTKDQMVSPTAAIAGNAGNGTVIISDELLRSVAEDILAISYRQASIFFENDRAAHRAAELMQKDGYVAVPSDTTYEEDAFNAILGIVLSLITAFLWFIVIVFLSFFINLCTGRAIGAFKGDMAIMRSMGIQVNVIRIAMYVRMLISLVPAFVLVALSAVLIFTTPAFNENFTYLYSWQYAMIFAGMLLMTVRVTSKQIRKLFSQSVKKSLKGGNAE